MTHRFLILLFAVMSAVLASAPVGAETTAQVVYDDGRPAEQVPLLHVSGDGDVWFMRANDVARLFRATQFWNATTRKIVLGIGRARFVLTVDTRVVVVDGEPYMMRTPVRYQDGFVLVPLEFMVEIAAQHTPRDFVWDEKARRLSIQGAGFNVTRITFATSPTRTTATIAMTEPLVYHVDTGTAGLVRLKLYGARADLRQLTVRDAHGFVNGVRAEQTERDAYLTFDLSRQVKQLKVDRSDTPPQIVVTLEKGTAAAADTGMVVLDEGATVRTSFVIKKVCIDAGHGGRDHGKENDDGVAEKDVTLSIARVVADQIRQQLGLEVVMTRDDDSYIPLRQRTEIANREKADLFISIHCNSWFNDQTGGFESYFLSPARSESERALARYENQAGGAPADTQKNDVDFILWDLAQNAYISESSTLAETIQREMTSRLGLKSRGVKQANFVVLQGAQMPAVLIETAFLTNPAEAQLLTDPDFQRSVADGLVASIKRMQEQYR
ncbi:MAG TPA: N-acetylmuramoyl-L-alanine amidase [Candidatus Krumholzibacteria bacterium]|nr:N-acetylmuramoyl-L-alanine amidase [Candidatus Krumholzibacteria bacterium]